MNNTVFRLEDNSLIHLSAIYAIGPMELQDDYVGCYIYLKYESRRFLRRSVSNEEFTTTLYNKPYPFSSYLADSKRKGVLGKELEGLRTEYQYRYPDGTTEVEREEYRKDENGELLALTNRAKELEPLIKAWSTYGLITL